VRYIDPYHGLLSALSTNRIPVYWGFSSVVAAFDLSRSWNSSASLFLGANRLNRLLSFQRRETLLVKPKCHGRTKFRTTRKVGFVRNYSTTRYSECFRKDACAPFLELVDMLDLYFTQNTSSPSSHARSGTTVPQKRNMPVGLPSVGVPIWRN
jgi:hypothetical protein